MILHEGDTIVCAYAQPASEPGWSNRPLWVIVRGPDGVLREECLQPEEMTDGMVRLYDISAAVNVQIVQAVERAVGLRGRS